MGVLHRDRAAALARPTGCGVGLGWGWGGERENELHASRRAGSPRCGGVGGRAWAAGGAAAAAACRSRSALRSLRSVPLRGSAAAPR